MARIDEIAGDVAALMPIIARRIILGFFQSVDLTQTQLFTIMALYEESPVKLSELSRKLHISAPTVTGVVDRLEKSGYVKRIPDNKDRRVINVDLTAKGQGIAKKFNRTIKAKWKRILEKLSKKDQENYVALLWKIQGNMK